MLDAHQLQGVTDAVANIAAASQLVLGIERSDLTLISRGLADRLHQPNRATTAGSRR